MPGGSSARAFVESYYDALRDEEPLAPYFAESDGVVKFGVSEHLDGYEAVAEGLCEQTRTTTAWSVESRDLRVTERERHAWFADLVTLGWTDAERSIRYEFDTRWSGTLERRGDDADDSNDGAGDRDDGDGDWRFVAMHVSTARDF